MSAAIRLSIQDLLSRARDLIADRPRAVVGIAGPPGAGKSTLAETLANGLQLSGCCAVVIGMDGFHLAQSELERLGRAGRKGAADTFDAFGYAALLCRLQANVEPVIYAPLFRRELEEPIANCVAVPRDVRCVITEGNYLLLHDDGWRAAREQIDEVWYLDVPPGLRQERLTRRRMGFGFTYEDALAWTRGSDERNAETVLAMRDQADLIVEVVPA